MSRVNCPNCGDLLVSPVGPASKVLLIGDYPDFEDVRTGYCLSSDVKPVLQAELVRVGLQLSALRYTNVWQHGKKEKECPLQWHTDVAFKELKGKTHVLVMGSDACQALFGKNAMEISGLRMQSELFPKIVFYAAPNPATLFHGNLGEFRLALERFKQDMERRK